MNVCRKCGKLPKPSQAMRNQLTVMSVLSLASCKPFIQQFDPTEFLDRRRVQPERCNLQSDQTTNKRWQLWKSKENETTCWILLDIAGCRIGSSSRMFLAGMHPHHFWTAQIKLQKWSRSGDIPSIEWTCWKRMLFDYSVIVKCVVWSSQNYRCTSYVYIELYYRIYIYTKFTCIHV